MGINQHDDISYSNEFHLVIACIIFRRLLHVIVYSIYAFGLLVKFGFFFKMPRGFVDPRGVLGCLPSSTSCLIWFNWKSLLWGVWSVCVCFVGCVKCVCMLSLICPTMYVSCFCFASCCFCECATRMAIRSMFWEWRALNSWKYFSWSKYKDCINEIYAWQEFVRFER